MIRGPEGLLRSLLPPHLDSSQPVICVLAPLASSAATYRGEATYTMGGANAPTAKRKLSANYLKSLQVHPLNPVSCTPHGATSKCESDSSSKPIQAIHGPSANKPDDAWSKGPKSCMYDVFRPRTRALEAHDSLYN
jgi:hypothetical protein